MTDDIYLDRRKDTCGYHHSMDRSIIELTTTMAALTKASNRVFAVGLALIGLALGAIFYAGQINEKVLTLEKDVIQLKRYVYPQNYLQGGE